MPTRCPSSRGCGRRRRGAGASPRSPRRIAVLPRWSPALDCVDVAERRRVDDEHRALRAVGEQLGGLVLGEVEAPVPGRDRDPGAEAEERRARRSASPRRGARWRPARPRPPRAARPRSRCCRGRARSGPRSRPAHRSSPTGPRGSTRNRRRRRRRRRRRSARPAPQPGRGRGAGRRTRAAASAATYPVACSCGTSAPAPCGGGPGRARRGSASSRRRSARRGRSRPRYTATSASTEVANGISARRISAANRRWRLSVPMLRSRNATCPTR